MLCKVLIAIGLALIIGCPVCGFISGAIGYNLKHSGTDYYLAGVASSFMLGALIILISVLYESFGSIVFHAIALIVINVIAILIGCLIFKINRTKNF